MIQYVCHNCEMTVKGLTCGSCGEALIHGTITTDAGDIVNVSKCPDGCGKIKSPQCCGNDMHNH